MCIRMSKILERWKNKKKIKPHSKAFQEQQRKWVNQAESDLFWVHFSSSNTTSSEDLQAK